MSRDSGRGEQFDARRHIINVLQQELTTMVDDSGHHLDGILGRSGAVGRTVSGGDIGVDLIEMQPGSEFALHSHEGDHILYALEGEGVVHVDGVDYRLGRGDTVFVPAEYPHGVKATASPSIFRLLAVGHPHRHVAARNRMHMVPAGDGVPALTTWDELVGPVVMPLRLRDEEYVFRLWFYRFGGDRWIAASIGSIDDGTPAPVRIESACVFGHVFHSARCDCSYQFDEALQRITLAGRGVVVYACDHDARGLGIAPHFAIYRMRQQEGLDTDAVYARLGRPVDARCYDAVPAILRHLGVRRLSLLTNNRKRLAFLAQAGFDVVQEPLEAPLDKWNMSTLMLEKEDLDYTWSFRTHTDWLLPVQEKAECSGLRCAVVVEANERVVLSLQVADSDWSLAPAIADRLHHLRERVVYLSDLPRCDEVALYSRLGAEMVVVPFPTIPRLLADVASSCCMRLQDWARRNRFAAERPQWLPVSSGHGRTIYVRGKDVRVVIEEKSLAGSLELVRTAYAGPSLGGPRLSCLVSGTPGWYEVTGAGRSTTPDAGAECELVEIDSSSDGELLAVLVPRTAGPGANG